jgi:ribosomal protein S18 acetylase RimI-like enzyme
MSLVVRTATADDFDAWYALRSAVASEGIWIGAEPPIARDEAAFVARVDSADAHEVVVDLDGTVVATAGAWLSIGVASFWMCVAADRRGQGIGRALVDEVIRWSTDVGAHKITLEVWPHNGPAIALYRAAGFVIEGRKVRHYRRRNGELWDAVMMARLLDDTSPGSPFDDAR